MVVCEAARQTKPLLHTLGNHFWTSELTCCRSMASQKTIKNFFKPVIKRKSEDLEAEIKQQCKKTPGLHENIGHSWYMALKSQFSQPYFE
ncbi:hypothetical protein Hamer_G026962, partial [Homarus americanus]